MNILVTGANRGLGLSIIRSLLHKLPSGSQHHLYLTARDLDKLDTSLKTNLPSIPSNFKLHLHEYNFSDTPSTLSLLDGLPELDHIFHTAAPYSRTPVIEASAAEREEFGAFSKAEETLLIDGAKKLPKGGSLIATGAIICETVNPKVPASHPWHCGLSSIQKAHLRTIIGALAQELGTEYKMIHANLGTFVEPEGNEEKIAAGEVLSIDDVAETLTSCALSDECLSDFNIDILSESEKEKLDELRLYGKVDSLEEEKESGEEASHSPKFF